MSKIIERILKAACLPALLEKMKKLKPTDQQSVLLELFQHRVESLTPAAVLNQYKNNRFVPPAGVSPVKIIDLEKYAFTILPETFDQMRLSPVSPLGSCSVLGTVDQNKVLSTIRNVEVCADPTNTMALETALRRKKNPNFTVRLAASQQVVRSQKFDNPAYSSHFTIFAVTSAGKRDAGYKSMISELREHIDFYLKLIETYLPDEAPEDFIKIKLSPFNPSLGKRLSENIIDPINSTTSFKAELDLTRKSGIGYYQDVAMAIELKTKSGEYLKVIDGGDTDWTAKLVSNHKEYFLSSCVGIELFLGIMSGSV